MGIITESDMLDAFLAQRSNDVTVEILMTEHVITVDEFTPAEQVLTILREQKIHHLPVVRQDVVVGLITPQTVLHYIVSHEFPSPPDAA